jgi:hypothetical protein
MTMNKSWNLGSNKSDLKLVKKLPIEDQAKPTKK